MRHDPVIVVGTTPDYVAKIYERRPENTFFLLDSRFRQDPRLDPVNTSSLLFTRLDNCAKTLEATGRYLAGRMISPQGVACFDCESLLVASKLALYLGKPFPPPEAVARSRNKFESRSLWRRNGLRSPLAILASDLDCTLEFFRYAGRHIVLKPISASGSELLFHCEDEPDVIESVEIMKEELPKRRSHPLFGPLPGREDSGPVDPCLLWIVEQYISGPEFSCDFLLEKEKIAILRETEKLKSPDQPFGSIMAYTIPPSYPPGFSRERLSEVLTRACTSLGFTWGHFMADFIVQNGEPVIIEIAPRPGGDSIPDLVEIAAGYDMLGLHLDIMSGRFRASDTLPMPSRPFASLNFYAPEEGILTKIDVSGLRSLSSVRRIFLKKKAGDRISLPPGDYDNRLLGYCIVQPEPGRDVTSLYDCLQGRLVVSIAGRSPGGGKGVACEETGPEL